MQELLQGKGKHIGCAVILLSMLMISGCEKKTDGAEKSSDQKNTVKTSTIETEDEDMDESLILKISELLGCTNKTAEGLLTILQDNLDGTIISISKDDSKLRPRLIIDNDEGKQFIAVVERGYTISGIFRDNENGEKIYSIIQ